MKAHQGVVRWTLVDGIMAEFGAPLADAEHTHKSLAAALDMLKRVEENGGVYRLARHNVGGSVGAVILIQAPAPPCPA